MQIYTEIYEYSPPKEKKYQSFHSIVTQSKY